MSFLEGLNIQFLIRMKKETQALTEFSEINEPPIDASPSLCG